VRANRRPSSVEMRLTKSIGWPKLSSRLFR